MRKSVYFKKLKTLDRLGTMEDELSIGSYSTMDVQANYRGFKGTSNKKEHTDRNDDPHKNSMKPPEMKLMKMRVLNNN